MPIFEYRAVDVHQRNVRGTINADTPRQARDQLRERKLELSQLHQKRRERASVLGRSVVFPRRYRHAVSSFFRELSTLLAVGLPLLDSLDILLPQVSGGFRSVLLQIRESVANGRSFSNALAEHPSQFDSFCISMAEVGENAGSLDVSLQELTDFRESRDTMKDRIVSALIYPGIVAIVTMGVTVFLMTVVVPTLLQNLVEMGRPLPWPTKVLKTLSDVLLAFGLPIAIVLSATFLICLAGCRTQVGGKFVARLAITIPLLRKLIRSQNCGRISLFVGTLSGSGLDLLKAFRIASQAISNPLYREALQDASNAVEMGRDLADALRPHAKLFPATVIQIFALGQNSGKLDTMLLRMARDLDRETANLANRVSTLVEPILIITLGLIVGFILLATMMPILEAGNVS